MVKDEYFDIFPNLIREYAEQLNSGEFHKGRFIGLYMDKIKELPLEEHERIQFKYPQFVSNPGCERSDNWLDYIVNMDKNEFEEFNRGIR